MQYAPTHTDQKIDSHLSIESKTLYISGRMQYAPTLTDLKLDSILSIESSTRYVLGRMQYAPTLTDQKFDFPLKHPTRNDLFFVSLCRGVLHTPHKYPQQWANESSARYVRGHMQYAPTLTDQKIDSPLKSPTLNDPFFVYRCRGVLHTPHKCP